MANGNCNAIKYEFVVYNTVGKAASVMSKNIEPGIINTSPCIIFRLNLLNYPEALEKSLDKS